MSTISHEQKRQNKKTAERGLLKDAKFYGAAVLAAAGVAYLGVEKVKSVNEHNQAKIEFEAPNQPHNLVSLDADTTIFGVASAAVDKGYLKMDPREASDFITDELNAQMHSNGLLEEGEHVDPGMLQPGTELRVPGSWTGIGKPEPRVEIGTAITAESDGKGNLIVKETDQSGHTTTTVEPQG